MMMSIHFRSVAALSFIATYVSALVLEPIRPPPLNLNRRDVHSALQLQNSETFLWGARNATALASFTVSMPGEAENILSMERFDGMLSSVSCTNSSLNLGFSDNNTFAYAKEVWDWVNGEDNHTFVMVAGAGVCQWNAHRQPFAVSSIAYDDAENTAYLNATAQDWQSVVHTYDLQVGHISSNSSSLARRFLDFDKSKTFVMNLAHQFPFTTQFTDPSGLSVSAECTRNCQFTGQLALEARIRASLFAGLEEASVKIIPNNISTTVETRLSLTGSLKNLWQKTYPIAQLGLDGLQVPGIASFGPELVLEAGFALKSLDGTVSLTTGAKATIPDDSNVFFDLANVGNQQVSGWQPQITQYPVVTSANIATGGTVYINTAAQLVAEVLGAGWKVGLNFRAPSVDFTVAAIEALNVTICSGKNVTSSISAQVDVGAKFDVEAAKADGSKTLFSLPLFELPHETFGPYCQAIDQSL